jgi:hypothetical protein
MASKTQAAVKAPLVAADEQIELSAEQERKLEIVGAWQIGAIYFVRTVTMADVGRLIQVTEHELVLEDAAWVADTGRFSEALRKDEFAEVEPFPDGHVIVNRASIIDACIVKKLQRVTK